MGYYTKQELELAELWFDNQKFKSNIQYPCKLSFIEGMKFIQNEHIKDFEALQSFATEMSEQSDEPGEFVKIVNENFWKILA